MIPLKVKNARFTFDRSFGFTRLCSTTSSRIAAATPVLGALYFTGVAAAVGLLVVEHSLVKPTDLSKVNLAFFTFNGIISLLLGTLGIVDVFV